MKNITKKQVVNFLSDNAIIILLILLATYVSFTTEGFASIKNAQNIITNLTPRFLIALGISGTLITKGTDLSAGRLVGLGGVVAATLLQNPDYPGKFLPNLPDLPVGLVFVFVIIITGLFGLLNGLIVSKLNVPPFLATLGMQTIVYGINLVYSRAEPIGSLKRAYTAVGSGSFLGIKYFIYISIIMGLVFYFLYNYTRYGKYMYAIGGNETAAEVSGVNTFFLKLRIYTLAGVMYGFAGFLLAAKAGGAGVNLGLGYELEAIAACTIGGVSTAGGMGTVPGVLLGVAVFEVLKACMQYLGIDTSWQYIVQGMVIIVAVAIDIRKYIKKK